MFWNQLLNTLPDIRAVCTSSIFIRISLLWLDMESNTPLYEIPAYLREGIQGNYKKTSLRGAVSQRTIRLQSIRGDETVNVNKPSPVSPQLTARSGQNAELVQCTHCIRTHVNLHSDFGHPCKGTRFTWSLHDFILRANEISRAFVYDDSRLREWTVVTCSSLTS
jgi:hypothetical protein